MTSIKGEWDASIVLGTIVVYALPLTLLIPGFSVWNVVPKIQVTRCHILSLIFSWDLLNATIFTLLMLLFCLYLEVRKRNLDDMVESVLTVSQDTDKALEVERVRQTAALRVCVDLLDASAEHYENLVLLREELKEDRVKQQPPAIDFSLSEF